MVIKYLLDTDIVISALKGKQTVDELLHLGEEGAAAALSIIIAATCIVNDLTLVIKNKRHFSRIKGLSIF